ncbi:hypothetical protein ACOSQ4_002569 [Xanthoceras sorbifolium]
MALHLISCWLPLTCTPLQKSNNNAPLNQQVKCAASRQISNHPKNQRRSANNQPSIFGKDVKRALDRIVSWEGFDTFMDDEGKFMEYIETDVKGILNYYEASYLAFEGENILDKALTFSTTHLNRFKTKFRTNVNGLLLELAKLDFNMVQSVLQSNLKDISVKNLPDYMKLCFMVLYNTINEMAYDSLKEHGENVIPYLTKMAELERVSRRRLPSSSLLLQSPSPLLVVSSIRLSLQIHYADDKYIKKRAKKLEEEVRCKMLHNEDAEMLSILELIDDIQRLGLGHRFEKDIKRALDRIVSWERFDVKAEDQKLHATALRFRLLRQHGYQVSQGENILDEALTFSATHLNRFKTNLGPDLSQLVSHALELPLHRRMIRLEARWYIEAFSQRKDVNGLLLQLAKLDFNMVQSILQSDLKDISRWWKEIDLAKQLNFVRDRLVEYFIWAVGMIPNPQFNHYCQELTKIASLITIIDDIYDVYDYMKLCFMVLYNTINEMAYDSLKEHGENVKLERGEIAGSILCYIRQIGANMIDEIWKKKNKDVVDDKHPFGKAFVETAINLARISHSTYQYGDGHGAPDVRAKIRVFTDN